MKKMRQKVDAVPQLQHKTPSAPGETLSEMTIAPMAFNLNQSSTVCLPLVSDSQMLIWVHSNEINLQPDGAAELDKAFDRFPYITQKQTAALAQRCSLHPDQVKVWFMVQRLLYGISWDYKDISRVRRKFKSSQGKEELQTRKGEEVKEDGGENKECKIPGGKNCRRGYG
ncbi:homeobox and leucine zipper encoding b isoform X3 [Cottoperca gobio]|nr:homeobox and leucine zipper protein Homez-like isoform X3 [Cottoperca gobio]